MRSSIDLKYSNLRQMIEGMESVIVAFSGGVDSSLVAYVTHDVLGSDNMLAITSGSSSLKHDDLVLARSLAQKWGMPHREIVTKEMELPGYRANPANRCYFCKSTLYTDLETIRAEKGFKQVVNGTNLDDLGDHRPGLLAADERSVRGPLADAGFTKSDIRALAAQLGLDNADKPQAACLSSRVPYGTAIDEDILSRIERAESVLSRLGFNQFRVRHHGDVARIELPADDFEAALAKREEIVSRINNCGYTFVALDLGGFKSGSMNALLK